MFVNVEPAHQSGFLIEILVQLGGVQISPVVNVNFFDDGA